MTTRFFEFTENNIRDVLDPPPYYDYAQFAAPPPGFVAASYVPQTVPHSQNLNLIATAQATGINPNRLPGYNSQPAYFCGRYGQPMPPTYDAAYSMNGMNGMSQSYYAIPTHRDEGGITYSVRIPQNELRHRRVMSYISLVFFVVIFVLFFVFMFSTLRRF
ncbi:hypothetical protein AAVH_35719 [Aphelenchoides avenae]|nr:hypothetical protein AAVH_35719 [Aphelenchus avenae]